MRRNGERSPAYAGGNPTGHAALRRRARWACHKHKDLPGKSGPNLGVSTCVSFCPCLRQLLPAVLVEYRKSILLQSRLNFLDRKQKNIPCNATYKKSCLRSFPGNSPQGTPRVWYGPWGESALLGEGKKRPIQAIFCFQPNPCLLLSLCLLQVQQAGWQNRKQKSGPR